MTRFAVLFLLGLAPLAASPAGVVVDVDRDASARFEQCLSLAAHLHIEEAVAASCPASDEELSGVERGPETSTEAAGYVLEALGVENRAGMCAERELPAEPAVAALCALLSNEQHVLATAQERRSSGGDPSKGAYASIKVSVSGVGKYVRHVLHAVQSNGFARLGQAIDVAMRRGARTDSAARDQLSALQSQADFLAQGLSIEGFGWRTISAAALEKDSTRTLERVLAHLRNAAHPRARGTWRRAASHHQVGASAHRTLVDSWAQDAANDYRERVRSAIRRAGLAPHDDPFAAPLTEVFVAQLMYESAQRAGHCAIACGNRSLAPQAVAVPIPISSDLLMPIELTQ